MNTPSSPDSRPSHAGQAFETSRQIGTSDSETLVPIRFESTVFTKDISFVQGC